MTSSSDVSTHSSRHHGQGQIGIHQWTSGSYGSCARHARSILAHQQSLCLTTKPRSSSTMHTIRICKGWKVFWPQTRFCSVTRGPEQRWTGLHLIRQPFSNRLCLQWQSLVGSVWRLVAMERFDEYAPLWISIWVLFSFVACRV